jgi:hypothetical protein
VRVVKAVVFDVGETLVDESREYGACLAEVVTAFEGFASGDPAWKDSFSWNHL